MSGDPTPKTATPRSNKRWQRMRRRVLERDGGCVARGVAGLRCQGIPEVHHLWRRSQDGPDEEWNLKTLCSVHHTWAHSHVADARALDLIRRRGETAPGVFLASADGAP